MEGFTTIVSIVFGLCALLSYDEVEAVRKAGPYDIDIKTIEQCEDGGTGEVYFGNKMNSKGHRLYTYTNMVTFKVPWDQRLKLECEVQKLSNGIYRPRYITQSFKGCQQAYGTLKDWMTEFFGAAGYEFKKCPLPAGNYSVTDWVVNLKMNNLPTMQYNSYKMFIVFTLAGKRVGCFSVTGDVIPKETSQ